MNEYIWFTLSHLYINSAIKTHKMITFLFIFFYFLALSIENAKRKSTKYFLAVFCVILAAIAGFRDVESWADTSVYVFSFENCTHNIENWNVADEPFGYAEYGFYFLGVILKTFTSNSTIYLLFIAALSFLFLYKDFCRYCYYPFIGLCVYVSRFYLQRNLIQIRAGLSYAIILWAVQYITTRDWKKYFFWVFIAYQFHTSALIAVPLYFLCLLNLKKRHILYGIIVAFLLGGPGSGFVKSHIADTSSDLQIVQPYVTEDYMSKLGLLNPMIYFQLFFLWIYSKGEPVIKSLSKDYYTIRTAYFYSTFLLISLNVYTTLSGRVSSMFATLEMAIIPMVINIAFDKKNRNVAYIGLGIGLSVIFFLNYYGH